MRLATLAASALAACLVSLPARAEDPFYKGKTIDMIIGYAVDNSFDSYGRVMARYMTRYLPGNPAIVVQNMPGAGSLRATNHLYNIAPRDGTTIGIIDQAIYLDQLLEMPGLQADALKFNWIGRMIGNAGVLFARSGAAAKNARDIFSKELIVAASGISSRLNYMALNQLAGSKLKLITGYDGTGSARLAMERGEIDALTQPWPAIKQEYEKELKEGKINLILQSGISKNPGLETLPDLMELADGPDAKKILEIFSGPSEVGRAIMAPPGVPADRVKELRTAFMKAIEDPALQADVAKIKLDLDPMSGEKLQATLQAQQYAPALLERARAIAKQAGQ
jgi:tripartite-type tricarboxylate transporter receptor subunit TctC